MLTVQLLFYAAVQVHFSNSNGGGKCFIMLPHFIHKRGKHRQSLAVQTLSLYLFLQTFSLCNWEKDIMLQIKLSESKQPLFQPSSFCFHCTTSNKLAGKVVVAGVTLLVTDNQHQHPSPVSVFF